MTTIKRSGFAGWTRAQCASFDVFFSYGFRPFFLGAAVYAALLMAVWGTYLSFIAKGTAPGWPPVPADPFAWHAHELVFGFAAAAIAGFLLTAVPNWTGALPLSGAPLVVLFLTWVAGRSVMIFGGAFPVCLQGAVDVSFLPLLGAFASIQLMVRPAPRNLVFLLLVAVLAVFNAAYHLAVAGLLDFAPITAVRNALLVVVIMIAIIGGRVVPAFTHNWVHLNAPHVPAPRRIAWLDVASIGFLVGFAMSVAGGAPAPVQGALAALGAVFNAARLVLWRGIGTFSEPIVWILHAGYAWLVAGLALSAASAFGLGPPPSLAFHAFGTGAAGTMILAVMSRASLGHTGRPLKAPPKIVWAYWLITLSAIFRVAGPLVAPQYSPAFLTLAAVAWIATFGLFTFVYAPILTTPRVHVKSA